MGYLPSLVDAIIIMQQTCIKILILGDPILNQNWILCYKTEFLQLILRQDTFPSFIKTIFPRISLKMENHLEWLKIYESVDLLG